VGLPAALIGVSVGTLVGIAIMAALRGSLPREGFVAAPTLGLGVIAVMLSAQELLGFPYTTSAAVALATALSSASALIIIKWGASRASMALPVDSRYRLLFPWLPVLGLPLLMLLFVIYFAGYPIVIFYDNIAYTAKEIFLTGSIPHNISLSPMEYTNAYPMLYPLQGVWLYLLNGGFDDTLIRVFPPLYFATFIVAVFLFCRKFAGSLVSALLSMALVFSIQQSVFMVEDINANAPLALYSTLSLFFAASFFNEDDRKYLIVSGLFAALAVFSRYQGLFLFGSMLFVIAFYSRREKLLNCVSFAAIPAIPLGLTYLRNALLFGNPVYPFYGAIFGSGFGFLPLVGRSVSVLLATSITYWSVPVLVFFALASVFLSRETRSVRFLYVLTACYSLLAISLGWGLSPYFADWSSFLPVIVPMCLLATIPFKYPGKTTEEAALASLFLLASIGAEIILDVFPYVTSVSFAFALGATIFSLCVLVLRSRTLAGGWLKPMSVILFPALLLFPTYAAANLKFVTVSVNSEAFSFSPQLYLNFTARSPQEVILEGKSIITSHDLNAIFLWAGLHLPPSARILDPLGPPFANRYYSIQDVVPLDGYELEQIGSYDTSCGIIAQLRQRGIGYVIAPAQTSGTGAELGLILQGTSPLLSQGKLQLRTINGC